MLREITPEETGILYECMEDLGRHHSDQRQPYFSDCPICLDQADAAL